MHIRVWEPKDRRCSHSSEASHLFLRQVLALACNSPRLGWLVCIPVLGLQMSVTIPGCSNGFWELTSGPSPQLIMCRILFSSLHSKSPGGVFVCVLKVCYHQVSRTQISPDPLTPSVQDGEGRSSCHKEPRKHSPVYSGGEEAVRIRVILSKLPSEHPSIPSQGGLSLGLLIDAFLEK